MKRQITAGVLDFLFLFSMMFSLTGCSTDTDKVHAADLMDGIKPNQMIDAYLTDEQTDAIADFSVKLFQNTATGAKNPLISPVSVLCALAMTANGAQGETLAQMEKVFGLPVSSLNEYLHIYMDHLSSGDKYKVHLANSIWFRDDDRLKVEKDFLQINADCYGASVYKAAFDDATRKDINHWVGRNTDGMIPDILDKIPEKAVMYLVNALAFDAEWEDIYRKGEVRDGTFTTVSGKKKSVKMMYGGEHMYLDSGSATGFMKYYADRKYALAALLPDEGISIQDAIAGLTGSELQNTLRDAQEAVVNAAIPKFESRSAFEMQDVLSGMGMSDAFDAGLADFTRLGRYDNGNENIFISRVIHKTYISVNEKGTRAGAATAVEMTTESAMQDEKTVCLDRPFVYLLLDCETNLPLFIGAVTDIGK
ncbi:serpin family protein [Eubacteriales bacterium mix99]|jgi:serpin B